MPQPGGVITLDGTLVNGVSQPYHVASGGFIRDLSIVLRKNDAIDAARETGEHCPLGGEGVPEIG